MRTALVVEDDSDAASLLELVLTKAGFDVTTATDGSSALAEMPGLQPDLVSVDLTLPDMDGVELCRRIRAESDCYLTVISGRLDEVDKLISLEVGADDFIAKPFSPREVQARVAALFRRPRNADSQPVATPELVVVVDEDSHLDLGGGLVVDLRARQVSVESEVVDLTRTEFELLSTLAVQPGVVFARDQLLKAIWESAHVGSGTHLVDVHIANVRRKLRKHGPHEWIRTVRGVGFRLDPIEA